VRVLERLVAAAAGDFETSRKTDSPGLAKTGASVTSPDATPISDTMFGFFKGLVGWTDSGAHSIAGGYEPSRGPSSGVSGLPHGGNQFAAVKTSGSGSPILLDIGARPIRTGGTEPAHIVPTPGFGQSAFDDDSSFVSFASASGSFKQQSMRKSVAVEQSFSAAHQSQASKHKLLRTRIKLAEIQVVSSFDCDNPAD